MNLEGKGPEHPQSRQTAQEQIRLTQSHVRVRQVAESGSPSHCKDLCCGCLCHHAQAMLMGQLHTLPSYVLQGSQGCAMRELR